MISVKLFSLLTAIILMLMAVLTAVKTKDSYEENEVTGIRIFLYCLVAVGVSIIIGITLSIQICGYKNNKSVSNRRIMEIKELVYSESTGLLKVTDIDGNEVHESDFKVEASNCARPYLDYYDKLTWGRLMVQSKKYDLTLHIPEKMYRDKVDKSDDITLYSKK